MNPNRSLKLNTLFHLIAVLVSGYLIYHHYAATSGTADFKSFCSINEAMDCDIVNASRFSTFLGIPLGTLGFAYHLFSSLISVIALSDLYLRREIFIILISLSGFSLLSSLGLLYISYAELKTGCIMCISLYVLNALTFIVSFIGWKKSGFTGTFREQFKEASKPKILRYLMFGAVGIGLVHLITYQSMNRAPSVDEELLVASFQSEPVRTVSPQGGAKLGNGNDSSPIQIIEFADYECPGCGVAAKMMHRNLKMHPGKIQLIFKNYPIDQACNPKVNRVVHRNACNAAKAGICMNKYGKFTEYFERAFENQKSLSIDNLRLWAKEFGVDSTQFDECMNSAETRALLQNQIEEAQSLSVESTPTFFVNGKRVEGAIDDARLRAIFKVLGK